MIKQSTTQKALILSLLAVSIFVVTLTSALAEEPSISDNVTHHRAIEAAVWAIHIVSLNAEWRF